MTRFFILAADGKTPIPAPDLLTWAIWYEANNRHVADEEVGPIRVSTVFLGLDHSFLPMLCEPVLWETMIFGGPGDLESWQERYGTYGDAVEGHRRAVQLARKALLGTSK